MDRKLTKDTLLVALMALGGGTYIKLLGAQTYYTLFVLAVTFLLTFKENFKSSELLRAALVLGVLISLQFIHSVQIPNYDLTSTQFLRSLVDVVLALLLSKRFQRKEISFVRNINNVLLVLIAHALLSVLIVRVVGHDHIVFMTKDESALYRGPNILFAVRGSTDANGVPVDSNVLGLGFERAHGIFWEPSVFVNYVALFLYINLFLRFNAKNVLLGLSAIVMAWSSTGFLLAAIVVIAFTFIPNATASEFFKSKLRRIRMGMLVFGLPLVMYFLFTNIASFYEDTRKLGSASQRFYDTAGALLAVGEHPLLGSGVNLDSYSDALANESNLYKLQDMAQGIDLNSKENIKYSNSFLRYLVKYGIPFGLVLFIGLWRQKIIDSQSKTVLFLLIAVGTSFSPILELMFFMPFLYSGLILNKLES